MIASRGTYFVFILRLFMCLYVSVCSGAGAVLVLSLLLVLACVLYFISLFIYLFIQILLVCCVYV